MRISVDKKVFSIGPITKGLTTTPQDILSYACLICKLHNDEKFSFLFQKDDLGIFHCPDPSTIADTIAQILPELHNRTRKKELKRLHNSIIVNHQLLDN